MTLTLTLTGCDAVLATPREMSEASAASSLTLSRAALVIQGSSSQLRYRESPGFAIVVKGKRIPLKLRLNLDGFGRIGGMLHFSAHEGLDAIRALSVDLGYCDGSDEDALSFCSEVPYCFLTNPLHDVAARRRLAPNEVAVKGYADEGVPEICDAMVAAGLLRRTGEELVHDYTAYVYRQPVFAINADENWNWLCDGCAKESATKMCGRCRSVGYCDRKCQEAGWEKHKKLCKQFKADTEASEAKFSARPTL